jgi:hypothetical protein
MSTFLTDLKITRKALAVLHSKPAFIGTIGRQYDDNFAQSGAKIGQSLRIRLPNQYVARRGLVAAPQATSEQSETLVVSTVVGADLDINSIDLTMSINDFSERFLDPCMSIITASIESEVFSRLYSDVYQFVGTAGVTPATILPFLNAKTLLNQSLTPKGAARYVQLDSVTSGGLVNGLQNNFNPSKNISSQYLDGEMGHLSGFDFFENELVPTHTNGTMTGSANVVVNGPNQQGSILNTSGWTAGATVTVGSVFTAAGCNKVHPEAKTNYGSLQQFVVSVGTSAYYTPAVYTNGVLVTQGFYTADANGLIPFVISPQIVTSGAYQNVSASPTSGGAIAFLTGAASTTYGQNIAYHKDAFTFVTADLDLPKGMDMAYREAADGISLSFVRGFDIINRLYISRFDVLMGYLTTRPQLACRITR